MTHERLNEQLRPSKVDQVWERANDSERFGFKMALFPVWVQEYELTHAETVELMKRG